MTMGGSTRMGMGMTTLVRAVSKRAWHGEKGWSNQNHTSLKLCLKSSKEQPHKSEVFTR